MKKEILQSIKTIALTLTLGLGVSVVTATWTPPPSTVPPSLPLDNNGHVLYPYNVKPINDSNVAQVKNGILTVNAFTNYGGASFLGYMRLSQMGAGSDNRPICLGSNKEIKICE